MLSVGVEFFELMYYMIIQNLLQIVSNLSLFYIILFDTQPESLHFSVFTAC